MDKADTWLNVPKLIEPEEFINPNVDEQSMMTHLSQYPNARLNSITRPKRSIESQSLRSWFGTSRLVGQQANKFQDIVVKNVQKNAVDTSRASFQDNKQTYTINYTPKSSSFYEINVRYNGQEVPSSPFTVEVKTPKVHASGPGLEKGGIAVRKLTHFNISTVEAGKGECEVVVLDPNRKQLTFPVRQVGDNVYRWDYVPQDAGIYSINVFYDGQDVPGSPFSVMVDAAHDAKKVRASGCGLQPKGVCVGDRATFRVLTTVPAS